MMTATAVALALAACGQKADCPRCPEPVAATTGGTATTAPAPAPAAAPPANAVQAEMRLLADAMAVAVRGVGTGDVREVQHALHRVHAAKEATGAAIASGAWKPAQRADQLPAFVAMDEAFHEHLGRLVAASGADDVPATAAALGDALRACDGCHAMFRAPPAVVAPAPPAPAPAPAHAH